MSYNSEQVRKVYLAKVEFIREIKTTNGCAVCGTNDFRVLHLHHRDPAEKHPRLRQKGRSLQELSWRDLRAEVLKCDTLCANHHAIETWFS